MVTFMYKSQADLFARLISFHRQAFSENFFWCMSYDTGYAIADFAKGIVTHSNQNNADNARQLPDTFLGVPIVYFDDLDHVVALGHPEDVGSIVGNVAWLKSVSEGRKSYKVPSKNIYLLFQL